MAWTATSPKDLREQTGSDAVLFPVIAYRLFQLASCVAQHNSVPQFPVSGIEGSTDEQRTYRDIS